jgi:hypothetical protein
MLKTGKKKTKWKTVPIGENSVPKKLPSPENMLSTLTVLPGGLTPTPDLPADAPLGVHRGHRGADMRPGETDDDWIITCDRMIDARLLARLASLSPYGTGSYRLP